MTVAPSSRARSFNAPVNVMIPKSTGTNGRTGKNTKGSRKPITIPRGVVTGIRRSRRWFILRAISAAFAEDGIRKE